MEVKISPPEGYPYFGWDEETTKKYIKEKPLAVGDYMIIYNGQGGFHHYVLAEVIAVNSGKQRRVVLSRSGEWGGTSFYRTGINCFSPKSQTRMLPPIPQIMEHLTLEDDVWLDCRY